VPTAAFIVGLAGGEAVRDRPVSPRLRRLIWAALAYTYVVVYLGAYVRHSGASLACVDWPLCNGALVPGLQGPIGVQFLHRVAAGVLVLLLSGLWLQTRRDRAMRPDLYRAGTAALALALVQALGGGLVILSRLELFTLLLHAALIALLFASLCYMAYQLIPQHICLPRRAPSAPAGTIGVSAK